jgi:hypothetical protein
LVINDTAFANFLARGFDYNFDVTSYAFVNISPRGFTISFGVINLAFTNLEQGGSPSTSLTTPLPTSWSGGIAIGIFDFAFTVNWSGRIPIYDIYDINRVYVIHFEHTKEFLASASQDGWTKNALDKQSTRRQKPCLAPMSEKLEDGS